MAGENGHSGAFLLASSCCCCQGSCAMLSVGRAAGTVGPLSFRARCGECACGWGRAGLGAARRGSAVGYFNQRCQGSQRGEERREKPSTLSKLGLGRGGLPRCCSAAAATRSPPAGPLRRSGSGHGGFFPLSLLSLSCSSLSLTFPALVCAGWGMGGALGGETALRL